MRLKTHDFSRALLERPNEWIRAWVFGNLSIVWDTRKPVPSPVPSSELIPTKGK